MKYLLTLGERNSNRERILDFELQSEYHLGKLEGCDIYIDANEPGAEAVSRLHATLGLDSHGIYIVDLRSTNGIDIRNMEGKINLRIDGLPRTGKRFHLENFIVGFPVEPAIISLGGRYDLKLVEDTSDHCVIESDSIPVSSEA